MKTKHDLTFVCFSSPENNVFGCDVVQVLQEVEIDKRRAPYVGIDRVLPRTGQ